MRNNGGCGGVGDIDDELVGLATGSSDDECTATESGGGGGSGTGGVVGEDVWLIRLVEADVVEV
jgi:uncharacterized spore protein YtfJ